MRKEVLLAIIIGVGLGLVLTFGIWTANRALREKGGGGGASPTPDLAVTPTPIQQFNLAILSPEEFDLFDKETILVSGTAAPFANLVILGSGQELATIASETGKWEISVKLVPGENEIKVVVFDANGEQRSEKSVTVVYSTKFDTQ